MRSVLNGIDRWVGQAGRGRWDKTDLQRLDLWADAHMLVILFTQPGYSHLLSRAACVEVLCTDLCGRSQPS